MWIAPLERDHGGRQPCEHIAILLVDVQFSIRAAFSVPYSCRPILGKVLPIEDGMSCRDAGQSETRAAEGDPMRPPETGAASMSRDAVVQSQDDQDSKAAKMAAIARGQANSSEVGQGYLQYLSLYIIVILLVP